MDIRASRFPVMVIGRRWLDWVNARHPWNHNEYFHRWILANLPDHRRLAVDIGCGTGVLAGRLAEQFTHVTGIDADAGMAAAASARLARCPRVSIRRCGFAEFTPTLTSTEGGGEADLVTMVAVLHHLDLDQALTRIPSLLAPGGRLLVVGLARIDSPADIAADLISLAANPVMGLAKHPRAVRRPDQSAAGGSAGDPVGGSAGGSVGGPVMPIKDAADTLAEIKNVARDRLPGVTVRRRLFFRYTLRWDKPLVSPGRLAHQTCLPTDRYSSSGSD